MENWLWDLIPWGYQVLLAIESIRTLFLDKFFTLVTEIGGEWFYITLLSLLYWCFSRQTGLGVAYTYLLSSYINWWLKDWFNIPRPGSDLLNPTLNDTGITDRVSPLFHETDASWPSNHAQGTMVTWAYLAWRIGRRWLWMLAAGVIILVAFSRMYGGVHFPQDVMGGLVIGLVYILLWITLEPTVRFHLDHLSFRIKLALAAILPIFAFTLHPTSGSGLLMGAAAGIGVGYFVQERAVGFRPDGHWWQRAIRALVGLVMVIGVYLGLKVMVGWLPEEVPTPLIRLLRYAIVGTTASLVAPWLFVKLKLAETTH